MRSIFLFSYMFMRLISIDLFHAVLGEPRDAKVRGSADPLEIGGAWVFPSSVWCTVWSAWHRLVLGIRCDCGPEH
jgi:hypothetical protein